jgi:hypothetical protein
LNSYLLRWKSLRVFVSVLLTSTSGVIVVLSPSWAVYFVAIGAVGGLALGMGAVLINDLRLAKLSSLATFFTFLSVLLLHALAKSITQYIFLLLLAFVILLYSFENLTMVCEQGKLSSIQTLKYQSEISAFALERAMNRTLREVGRKGVIFASCYAATVLAVYVGSVVASISSFLTDTSLYFLAVSASLALLLTMHEEGAGN